MPSVWLSLLRYFGLGEEQEPERTGPIRLRPARDANLTGAAWGLALAVVTWVVGVLMFDWQAAPALARAALGGVAFGVGLFFLSGRRQVPPGPVPEPPPGAVVLQAVRDRWRLVRIVSSLAFLGLVLWIAEPPEGLAASIVPGCFAGFGASGLVSALLIGRWERANAAVVVADERDPGHLYAVPPLAGA